VAVELESGLDPLHWESMSIQEGNESKHVSAGQKFFGISFETVATLANIHEVARVVRRNIAIPS
jgi:hypothetical protein